MTTLTEKTEQIKINGAKYEVTWREKNLIETALNDLINVGIVPNEGFEGLIATHKWEPVPGKPEDYIFAAIYFNPKTGLWDLYKVTNNFDDETKIMVGMTKDQAINRLRDFQHYIWGDAKRKTAGDPAMGVFLRETR